MSKYSQADKPKMYFPMRGVIPENFCKVAAEEGMKDYMSAPILKDGEANGTDKKAE